MRQMEDYVIVFVDTENCSPSDAVQSIISTVRYTFRNATCVGIYCFALENDKRPAMEAWKKEMAGMRDIHWIFLKGKREKNKVDHAIADKVDKLLGNAKFSRINKWVFVTSDSDFVPVIEKIKMAGRETMVIGSPYCSSKLMKACDQYFLY